METGKSNEGMSDPKKTNGGIQGLREVCLAYKQKSQQQFTAKEAQIMGLKEEITLQNAEHEKKYKEKEEALENYHKISTDLRIRLDKLTDQLTIKDQQTNSLKFELQTTKTEFEGKNEEIKILEGRLADEQQRWDEVLQMKEKDFKILMRELEKKATDWEGQYQKDEEEIKIVKTGRAKLEQQTEDLSSQLRSHEIKAREQLDAKDTQIATIKRESDFREKAWKEKVEEMNHEVESIHKQMAEVISETGDKSAPAVRSLRSK